VDPHGNAVAFANIVPSYRLNEGVIDLMRRLPEAPGGVMDLLFVSLAEYFKNAGYKGLNLGLAPLAGLGAPGSPPLEKAALLFYERFNAFYNFKGLRRFKEKFNPRWEPRYLIYPASWLLPKVALAVVRANSGGGLRGYLKELKFHRRSYKA
jgi:phosphatidylglycerol lysyltransferase